MPRWRSWTRSASRPPCCRYRPRNDDRDAAAIDHDNAAALFPRLACRAATTVPAARITAARNAIKDSVVRAAFRLVDPARS